MPRKEKFGNEKFSIDENKKFEGKIERLFNEKKNASFENKVIVTI